MKSPLEISPNKFLIIVFIFALFVVPILLIISGVKFNPTYGGLAIGLCLVIFFFLIYPRISKNKEFIEQMKEDKKMQPIIRQYPDAYKLKIAGVILLFLLAVVSIWLYFIKQIWRLEFIAPGLVFILMMYYAYFLKQHKETIEIGEKLENTERTGFNTFRRLASLRIIISLVIIIIFFLFILYIRLR